LITTTATAINHPCFVSCFYITKNIDQHMLQVVVRRSVGACRAFASVADGMRDKLLTELAATHVEVEDVSGTPSPALREASDPAAPCYSYVRVVRRLRLHVQNAGGQSGI
jgi:hypothetical protein